MAKPRGAICNLDCEYCYYLSKESLYPGSSFRMTDAVLEEYTRQYIDALQVPEVTFTWQGGEPTLMGVDFFRRAAHYQQEYAKPGMRIQNALQTNGTTLNEEWCRFFKDHRFLIGLSIDGPREQHDAFRVDKGGVGSFDQVIRGGRLLRDYGVECNVLCTVHAANQDYPLEVYRFFRDELTAQFIQFIPIVERADEQVSSVAEPEQSRDNGGELLPYDRTGTAVTERSVTPAKYGRFLSAVFDEWVRRDVGQVYVQILDVSLAAWAGQRPGLCVFEETCGRAMALEHNGDLYSCDHFVEPAHRLGNIQAGRVIDLVGSDQQQRFGLGKRDSLPDYCRRCQFRFVCNGGCPRNRLSHTPDGDPGLNYLCAGYRAFFSHIDPAMRFMAQEVRIGRAPANIMAYLAERDEPALRRRFAEARRNDPCPCGSGLKFKRCHGRASGRKADCSRSLD
jgi:uncharacterized protein